jgi:hypothetical protein
VQSMGAGVRNTMHSLLRSMPHAVGQAVHVCCRAWGEQPLGSMGGDAQQKLLWQMIEVGIGCRSWVGIRCCFGCLHRCSEQDLHLYIILP